MYTLEFYNLDSSTGVFTRLAECITFSGLSWIKRKNKSGELKFSLNIYDDLNELITPFKTHVLLLRNNTPIDVFHVINFNGSASSASGEINYACASHLYHFEHIHTDGRYVKIDTDAGVIAQDLINIAQAKTNGDFGVQFGTVETIGNINETLFDSSIGDALVNQSDNINGYDFEFRPILDANNKLDYVQFSVFNSIGVIRDNVPPLEYGRAVQSVTFAMKQEIFNSFKFLPQGTGELEAATANSLGSQTGYTRRELVKKEQEVSTQSQLQSKADTANQDKSALQWDLAITLNANQTPTLSDFNVGDVLPLNIEIPNTNYKFVGTAQVKSINVRFDTTTGEETVSPIIYYS